MRFEKNELGKPSLVIHSTTMNRIENEIAKITHRALEHLNGKENRKRFAVAHTEEYVYIIGGKHE